MKKTGLTMEQHRELGRKLKGMQRDVTHTQSMLVRAYPIKDGYERRLQAIENHLWKIRSDLENAMSREHPSDEWDLDVYYGKLDE